MLHGGLLRYALKSKNGPKRKFKNLKCKKTSENGIEGQRCPEKQLSVEILHAAYMFIGNILLLNLLIALFSSTFEKIEEKTIQLYDMGRYHQGPFFRFLKI